MLRRSSLRIALASLAFAAALPAHAGFWSSLIDTTPAGIARSSEDRPGDWASFWSDTRAGAEKIMSDGNSIWILPAYTNHPRWDWPQREEENGWPMGMGLARGIID